MSFSLCKNIDKKRFQRTNIEYILLHLHLNSGQSTRGAVFDTRNRKLVVVVSTLRTRFY